MAVSLAQGKGSTVTNALLELFVTDPTTKPDPSYLVDATSVVFEVWKVDGDAPVQVGGPAPDDAAHLALGWYVAEFTPGTDDSDKGLYEVRWTYVIDTTTYEATTSFEVLDDCALASRAYVSVSDLRDEGFSLQKYSDKFVQAKILKAGALLDRFTGRRFLPTWKAIKLDGNGARGLLLNEPICTLGEVLMDSAPFNLSDIGVLPDLVRVYNRHLTQELFNPDDRENPRIEFFSAEEDYLLQRRGFDFYAGLGWPRGQQNITIRGVFGYTEGPGIPGDTPLLVKQIVMLLVAKDLFKLSDADALAAASFTNKIIMERTRDQQVQYSDAAIAGREHQAIGFFTGDPLVDNMIAMFVRPPMLGSA